MFFDYKQIEYRLLAYYIATNCKDTSMADVFRAGKDLHAETAKAILGLDREPTDEERDVGKTYNFLTIYGGGPAKAALNLGIPLKVAKEQQDAFYATWPSIKKLHNPQPRWPDPNWVPGLIQKRLDDRGYITTLWGRHLHPRMAHAALNNLVQGCAADLMRYSMIQVSRALKEGGYTSHIVNVVHDELILDCTKEEVAALSRAVPLAMNYAPINDVVPIEVDTEISWNTWADKEPYSDDGNADDLGRPGLRDT